MKFIIICLFVFIRTELFSQTIITDAKVALPHIAKFNLNQGFEFDELIVYDIDSIEILKAFNINVEKSTFFKLSYSFYGLPLKLYWYNLDNDIFVDKVDWIKYSELVRNNWKGISKEKILNQLENKTIGVKKVKFTNNISGTYLDKVFNHKRLDFYISVTALKNSTSFPVELENKSFIRLDEYNLADVDCSIVFSFNSRYWTIVDNLEYHRKIYFSINNQKIISSEIRSLIDDFQIDPK